MDNNPIAGPAPIPSSEPTPTPTPAPEPTPTPEPELTPEQNPAPATESTLNPQPVATPAPEPTPEPIISSSTNDATTTIANQLTTEEAIQNPADQVVTATPDQGKKKLSGKIIGLIATIGILIVGVIALLILHFASSTPDKVFNSAIENLLKQKVISFDSTSEITADEQNIKFSVGVYADNSDIAYMRISGIGEVYEVLLSGLGVNLGEEITSKISELEGVWWKLNVNGEKLSNSSLFTGSADIDYASLAKVAKAYEKHPFLIAEKTTGAYRTSGTAYKISIDKNKYNAFKESIENDNIDSLSLGSFTINDETDAFVATVSSSFFGNGTLTGIYWEQESDSVVQKSSIDFEHAIKNAPTDAKDISELENILNEITSSDELPSITQSDSKRREDYYALLTSVYTYVINNDGNLPPVGVLDATKYINNTGKDPDGNTYTINVVEYTPDKNIYPSIIAGETPVYVVLHATCDDNELAEESGGHAFAIYGALENDVFCFSHD